MTDNELLHSFFTGIICIYFNDCLKCLYSKEQPMVRIKGAPTIPRVERCSFRAFMLPLDPSPRVAISLLFPAEGHMSSGDR